MNFLKRALMSTKVKKGRTLLLTLVFSAILIFILAGLIIQNASMKAIDNAKNEAGATVTLSTSRESAFGKMEKPDGNSQTTEEFSEKPKGFSITPVDLTVASEMAELDNVESYNYISSTSANASSFDAISSSSESSSNSSVMFGGDRGQMSPMSFGDLTINGTSNTDTLSDFTNGTSTLIEGVGITEEDFNTNNAVIETNLAEANDLAVGDTIEITYGDEETAMQLTIVGIYESTSTLDSRMMNVTALNPANTIYTSYSLANTIKGTDYENTADSVVYTLTDPEQVDAFIEDAEAAGLDTETYSLSSNTQVYEQMLQPLENVKEFAGQIVTLVTIAGVIILSLIVILMVRERKQEVGILLSLGEKRSKVIGQFFAEMIIVLIVALCIAGVSGKYVGNIVGEQLLNQQSETVEMATEDAPNAPGAPGEMRGGFDRIQNFGASSQASAEQITDLDIAVSTTDFLKLGGFGLLITMISIVVASVGILRLQPKKILIS